MKPEHTYRPSRFGKALAGLLVLGAGIVLFMRQLGTPFPEWLFTWPVLVILLGFYIGAKHAFRHAGWLVPVFIGGAFLLEKINPGMKLSQFIVPLIVILVGAWIIFDRRRKHHHWKDGCKSEWKEEWKAHLKEHKNDWNNDNWRHQFREEMRRKKEEWRARDRQRRGFEGENLDDDYIDTVSVFGGVKKNILSKNFKGGEITTLMGGTEINLTHADIQGRVELEVTQVCGGTKLIIPPHWNVQSSEMVAVFGGIEDKRPLQNPMPDDDKVLVLRGSSIMGGIEILSF